VPIASRPKKLGYAAAIVSGATAYISGLTGKSWEAHTIRSDGKATIYVETDIDEDGTYELTSELGAITADGGGEMHAYKIELDEYARFKIHNDEATDTINIAVYGIEYSDT
jgi:hypothetical protein